uniref:Uncharacterized protein n=1 Tax=Panagrolaimus sp. PS1159 TaxID=55785 RepID=A0AC35FNH9_9BILA
MPSNDQRVDSGNDETTIQNETNGEVNNHNLARADSTSTAELPDLRELPLLPDLQEKERSIICCCFMSQGALRFYLLTYWAWTLMAFVYNVDTVFPALYLFPLCTMLFAFIGSTINTYQLLIPFMFMLAYDMLYATTCAIYLVSFHNIDRNALSNKFLYDIWEEKAQEFDEMNRENFELWLTLFLFKVVYAMAGLIITGQEITRFRIQLYIEKRRQEINRLRALHNSINEEARLQRFLNEAILSNQNPYAEIFSQHPPPPSYQTFSHPVLRTPQMGTPPPTYSTLERQGRLVPPPIHWPSSSSSSSLQSNNNQVEKDSSETSLINKRFDESTAMSPSSFLHSPAPSTTKE